MFLQEIKEALLTVDPVVYYGAVNPEQKKQAWDYIVFNRKGYRPSAKRTGCSFLFDVHIVRESFIPEGVEESVVRVLTALPGVNLVDGDHGYTYAVKPDTELVVEMLTLTFAKAVKVNV